MSIQKRFWNWCRRPRRSASRSFLNFASPAIALVFVACILITACVAGILLPPFMLFNFDESTGVAEILEVIDFPGGSIVVTKHSQVPGYPPHITIRVTHNVTSEEDLLTYINSRTYSLFELLNSVDHGEMLSVAVVFKAPLEPNEFTNFCRSFVEDAGEYVTILANETTGEVLGSGILKGPSPQDTNFEETLRQVREGYNVRGVIAFTGFMKANVAGMLQSNDSRILLVDPREDLTIRGLMKKYRALRFDVMTDSPIEHDIWDAFLRYGDTMTDDK